MTSLTYASLTKKNHISIIEFKNPPVNALSQYAVPDMLALFKEANNDPETKVIILMGGNKSFIGGADINEFFTIFDNPSMAVFDTIDYIEHTNKKITIAAIDGYALGGGLEVALACDYRVALNTTKIGFPEVHIGVLPGAGGTQKAPRLMGVEDALNFMINGKPMSVSDGLKHKLIDKVFEENLVDNAIEFAHECIKSNAPKKYLSQVKLNPNPALFDNMRNKIALKKRGFISPFKIIDCVKAATEMSYEDGIAFERKAFLECVMSKECHAQIHAFFAEKTTKKIPDIPKDTPSKTITQAAVYGLGNMGSGIAMNFANAGIPVKVFDKDKDGIDRGLSYIKQNYEVTASKGKISQEEIEERLKCITPCEDLKELNDVDILVEAVFEKMSLKKELFKNFDTHIKPAAILASNTSALNIDEIASVTKDPSNVIGIHFFNPANVMKAVEVVRGKHSSPNALMTGMNCCRTMKKLPILVGNCDGFIANRMFFKYFDESMKVIFHGAPIVDVDMAIYEFGMPMGPLVLNDLTGINLSWTMIQEKALTHPEITESAEYELLKQMINENRLGQRSAKGFYSYQLPNRMPIPDAQVQSLVSDIAKKKNIPQLTFTKEEIIQQLIYPIINEGAKILEEKIAIRSSDIDILCLYAYGFPPYKGGPMYYADQIGLPTIVDRLKDLEKKFGQRFKPAKLLLSLAKDGKTFGSFSH